MKNIEEDEIPKNEAFMWECECGRIDYGEYPPEECSECQAVGLFTKVPDDLREKKEAENVLSSTYDGEEE